MDTINISVNVTVDLSENTKAFIAKLFTSNPAPAAPAKPAPQAPAPASQAPAKPAPQAQAPATPAPAKPAAAPTSAPKAETSGVTIEQVRQALALKVNNHREDIKAKLNELGAPSVTKLDPAKYGEMLSFLNDLD